MTLHRRIGKLEGAIAKPMGLRSAVVREILGPSASGPDLVALIVRQGQSEAVRLDREPAEDEAAFRARFDAECAS